MMLCTYAAFILLGTISPELYANSNLNKQKHITNYTRLGLGIGSDSDKSDLNLFRSDSDLINNPIGYNLYHPIGFDSGRSKQSDRITVI